MLNSCLVFQEVIRVIFIMNGHVTQGLLHGLEPMSIRSGLVSALASICLRFVVLLLTTRIWLSSIGLRSSDSWSNHLYFCRILLIGGLDGL